MAAYYLLREGGQPEGPIRKTELCRMVEAGEVGPEDQISATQYGPWSRIRKVPQLAALFASARGSDARAADAGWPQAPGAATPSAPMQGAPPFGGAPVGGEWDAPSGGGWGAPPGGAGGPPGGGWGAPPGGGWNGGAVGGSGRGSGSGPLGGNFDEASGSPLLVPAKLVQRVMDALNEIARGGLLESLSASAIGIGHLGLIVGGAAVTLFAVVFAMRLDSLKLGILALLVPVAVAVLQFGDWKFLDLCGKVVRNTKTRTSSLALYQYVALLTMIAAAGSVAAGTYAMIEVGGADGRNYFLAALAVAAYLAIVGLLFLTPDALNLEVDETCSAGEDGIGLIGTLLKAGLAAARLVFGTLCALGAVCAAIGAVWFTTDAMEPRAWLWFSAGLYLLVIGALNPIVLYLISVLYYILPDLVIGVIRHTRPRDA